MEKLKKNTEEFSKGANPKEYRNVHILTFEHMYICEYVCMYVYSCICITYNHVCISERMRGREARCESECESGTGPVHVWVCNAIASTRHIRDASVSRDAGSDVSVYSDSARFSFFFFGARSFQRHLRERCEWAPLTHTHTHIHVLIHTVPTKHLWSYSSRFRVPLLIKIVINELIFWS